MIKGPNQFNTAKATHTLRKKGLFSEKSYLPNCMDATGPPYPNIPKYGCIYTKNHTLQTKLVLMNRGKEDTKDRAMTCSFYINFNKSLIQTHKHIKIP